MKCQTWKLKRLDQILVTHQRKLLMIGFSDSCIKAVDKIGRTARRTIDTHIKNVLSKPRVATTMRRMTAMFNFSADLRMLAVMFLYFCLFFNTYAASISSIDEKPDLQVEPTVVKKRVERPPLNEHLEIKRGVTTSVCLSIFVENFNNAHWNITQHNYGDQLKPMEPDSATESDADVPVDRNVGNLLSSSSGPSKQDENQMDDSPTLNRLATPAPVAKVDIEPSSGSESSPHRPTKRAKAKISSASDGDSESDSKPHVATSGGTRRGTAPRQPIKRGGKRF